MIVNICAYKKVFFDYRSNGYLSQLRGATHEVVLGRVGVANGRVSNPIAGPFDDGHQSDDEDHNQQGQDDNQCFIDAGIIFELLVVENVVGVGLLRGGGLSATRNGAQQPLNEATTGYASHTLA